MSIADLKTRLHDVPGIETLTMQMLAGRQNYSVAGRLVSLDAGASDVEVEQAIFHRRKDRVGLSCYCSSGSDSSWQCCGQHGKP
jgi:hypothetical protein